MASGVVGLLFFGFIFWMLYVGIKGIKRKKILKQQEQIKQKTSPIFTPANNGVEISDFATFTISSSFDEVEPSFTSIGENEWEITTPHKKTFTLYHAQKETVEQLFVHLKNRFGAWRERTVPIEMLIHESDMRCREIDAFLEKAKEELSVLVKRREQKSDWNDLSKLDKEDEINGIQSEYFDHLTAKPNCNADSLYSSMGSKSDADDELIKFYGVESITPYMRCLSRSSNIQKIPASHYNREDYELLVKNGLARKGKDIPIEDILQSLTLKEMNEMVVAIAPKPFTRKPKATEFLLQQPNLMDTLNNTISFNQLFQALPLDPKFAHINLDEIASSWEYDTELANCLISAFDRGEIISVDEFRKEESEAWRKEMGFTS